MFEDLVFISSQFAKCDGYASVSRRPPRAMSVYVGLDCGGSSSRVMAVDDSGSILFQGQSGAANLASTPENRLRKNLVHATNGCPIPKFVCGCFAGLVSEEIRAKGIEHLQALFPNAVVRAEPDYTAAFYASPPETDICVIAGTGSLVCSRDGEGVVKSGGRGFILGDAGSAYQYGRDALNYYLDNPSTASSNLQTLVQEVFGTTVESGVIGTVYKAQTPATLIAKLAKALANDARAGNAYALESINLHSAELASIVARHAIKQFSGRDALNITLAGGLWKVSPLFRQRLTEHLIARLPSTQLEVARINRPPLHGAVQLARQLNSTHDYHGN